MTSPALSSARAAGPLPEMPITTTRLSISVENIPSHGRAGLLTRPNLRRSSSTGLSRSVGTRMLTCSAFSPGLAPMGMRRIGKDCLVQQISPVAGDLLLGGDLAGHRSRAPAGAADHDA